jgi:hypothetical protein
MAPRPDEAYARPELSRQELQDALGTQYYGIYVNGRRAGRSESTLSRAADGSYVNRVTGETVLLFDGKRDQGSSEHAWVFAAEAPHPLVRAESTVTPGKGSSTRHLLEATPDGWRLTTRKGAFTHVKPVAPVEFTLADFLAADAWLRRPHEAGDTLTVRDLELSEGRVRPTRYRIQSVTGGTCTYEQTDSHGSRWQGRREGKDRATVRLGCWEMRQEASPSGGWLEGAPVTGRVQLTHPLGKVGTIERLSLKATGPAAAGLGSGPGQTVKRAGDGSVTVTLGPSAAKVRATPEEVADCLEDTSEYPHQDAEVLALLRQALGTEARSRRETAAKLVAFLHGYLTYDAGADPESVPEVIRTRRGVCRHYADLLTTLLRAAGIPARSVSGLACGGGAAFDGHRWTELVCEDGTWIGVDPTFGQTRTTAHVRFTPNDEGTLTYLELDRLQLEVAAVSHSRWGGWRYLLWGAGVVLVLVVAGKVVRARAGTGGR